MTELTYTLTQAQLDKFFTLTRNAICYELRALKPNLQEPDAVVFQSAKNIDGQWSSIVLTKTELLEGTSLYIHPAPMSTEKPVAAQSEAISIEQAHVEGLV